jgi:hypothetical protein
MDASLQAIGISPAHQQNLLTPIGATLSPLNNNSSSHRRENPARYNFSITKQRSSSESAFCLQKQKGVVCDCPGTQHTAQCQAMSEPTRDAHGNELLVDGPFSSMKRRLSIAFINPNREQVILQKILGPTGLGWLKKGQHRKRSSHFLFGVAIIILENK